MWGGLFSTFDCAIKGIRKKEDPYNASMFSSFIVVRFSICKQVVLTASPFFSSHCRFLHWWCFGSPWWLQGRQKLCHYVRCFPGCYRRCWYWFPEDDGRQHKARREFRILCRSELYSSYSEVLSTNPSIFTASSPASSARESNRIIPRTVIVLEQCFCIVSLRIVILYESLFSLVLGLVFYPLVFLFKATRK